MLTATRMAEVAEEVGRLPGLEVEVVGDERAVEMGCGGLLGVNPAAPSRRAWSSCTTSPTAHATGHLALVGKGIMYDSGGIALKPGDAVARAR